MPALSFQTFDSVATISGGNVLGRWKYFFSEASEIVVQAYYDIAKRKDVILDGAIHTFDVDFQHLIGLCPWNEIIWGLGYRRISDHIKGTFHSTLVPENLEVVNWSAFIQDKVFLANDRICLTLGSKFERIEYTGLEIEPNVRLTFKPHDYHTFWGAISRAARTPSRSEMDLQSVRDIQTFAYFPPILQKFAGNRDFESEQLTAYEIGYRVYLPNSISLDLTTFYNSYNKLRSYEIGTPYEEKHPPAEP